MAISLSDHFTYRRLLRFVLPTVVMMIFTSIYGIVDGLFVSNFVGKTPFAAINLIMPFVCVIGGMGFMIGTGGTALVSKTLGEGDRRQANRYFSMMVYAVLILSAVLSVLGVVFMRPVSLFLGATGEMLEDCVIYGRISIAFTFSFMLQILFQSFFIAAEKPRLGLIATVAAGVTNMVLDAVFVALLKWGVVGAAAATGISKCVGGILPLFYFALPNGSLLRLVPAKPEIKPILKACANGASELMSNISASVIGMLYNFQLMRLIGENGVSAYGVLMYTMFIYTAIFFGYSAGSSPIVSYHYGAKNTDELKNMLEKSLVLMAAAGVLLTAEAELLSPVMARLFVGYDAELCALTTKAFRIYTLHFILMGLNIFFSGFFTALNNGAVSAAISFLRTLVLQVCAVLILPLILGADGIWWAVIVAEIGASAVSVCFLFGERKRYGYMK